MPDRIVFSARGLYAPGRVISSPSVASTAWPADAVTSTVPDYRRPADDRGRADQLLGRRPHPGAQNGIGMTLTASQADWLRVRSYLQEHRHALAVDAAGDYPAERRMAGTPLLAAPEWQPAEPVPLHDIELEFSPHRGGHPREPPRPLLSAPAGAELPERPDGTPLPQLLGGAAGPGRPGGVREPPHLPADRGRPHQAPAGVHPRPLLRRRGHRRGGRARVRRRPARRPGRARPGRRRAPGSRTRAT